MTTQINVSHCLCFEPYNSECSYSKSKHFSNYSTKCPYLSKRRDGIDQGNKGEDTKFPIVEYYKNKDELKKLRKQVKKLKKKYSKLKKKYKSVKYFNEEEENIDLEIIEPPTPCLIKTIVLDDCKKGNVEISDKPNQDETINEELYYDKNFAAMEEDEPEVEVEKVALSEPVEEVEEEVEVEEEEVEVEEEVETEEEEEEEEEEEVEEVEEEVETEEVEEEEEEVEEEVEEEEEEVEEEVEEEEEEVEEEEEEVEEVEEVEEEEEEVEEEVETEEEEEVEEEVELFTYRKKKYWATDSENGVLYEITADEDIGDEVGKIVNGKVKLYKK